VSIISDPPTLLLDQVLLTYEVRGLGELMQHLDPEIHRLVVHAPQLRGQLHLVNAERDTLNIEKMPIYHIL
jgi:hypothetical protein